jgi:hypothetical protein
VPAGEGVPTKRITAALVEVALFAAVVWVVATGGPWVSTRAPATGPSGPTPRPTVRPAPLAPSTADVGATVTSDETRVGFIGLPPRGAKPSTPETGELMLSFSGWPTPTGFLHRVWIYADGRLIWARHGDVAEGANQHLTGFLEQRLTPEGVELFRSEVMSTGLLDDDRSRGGGEPVPWYIDLEVRSDGRLVRLERASDVGGLIARFVDPASWLPAGAWEEREIKAYVPSRHAVCSETTPSGPIEPALISTVLPASIEGSLHVKELDQLPAELAPAHSRVLSCSDVTTEEARAISEALERAGFERDGVEAHRLTYRVRTPQPIRTSVSIWFEPYLPHGEPINSMVGEHPA